MPHEIKGTGHAFGCSKGAEGELKKVLDILASEGKADISKKGKYGKSETFAQVGTFFGHAKGFGFVTIEG